MTKYKKTISLISILFLFSGVWAEEKERHLSLEECILTAIQNNLGVAVQVLNPELADISVSLAQERFLPKLYFGYGTQNTNQASFSWIEATEGERARVKCALFYSRINLAA